MFFVLFQSRGISYEYPLAFARSPSDDRVLQTLFGGSTQTQQRNQEKETSSSNVDDTVDNNDNGNMMFLSPSPLCLSRAPSYSTMATGSRRSSHSIVPAMPNDASTSNQQHQHQLQKHYENQDRQEEEDDDCWPAECGPDWFHSLCESALDIAITELSNEENSLKSVAIKANEADTQEKTVSNTAKAFSLVSLRNAKLLKLLELCMNQQRDSSLTQALLATLPMSVMIGAPVPLPRDPQVYLLATG